MIKKIFIINSTELLYSTHLYFDLNNSLLTIDHIVIHENNDFASIFLKINAFNSSSKIRHI